MAAQHELPPKCGADCGVLNDPKFNNGSGNWCHDATCQISTRGHNDLPIKFFYKGTPEAAKAAKKYVAE